MTPGEIVFENKRTACDVLWIRDLETDKRNREERPRNIRNVELPKDARDYVRCDRVTIE